MMPTTTSGGHHRFMTLTPWRRTRRPKPLRITFWINGEPVVGPFTLEEIHSVLSMIPEVQGRLQLTSTLSISVDR